LLCFLDLNLELKVTIFFNEILMLNNRRLSSYFKLNSSNFCKLHSDFYILIIMCTVTLSYQENSSFILTSSRDEAPDRLALFPDFYTIKTTQVLMPKDQQSGGSWIGASEKNRVICLLNGGFTLHKRQPEYRQSRGVVVSDFLVADDVEKTISTYNFNEIEPFTIVIVDWNTTLNFYQLVWDGNQKHFSKLPLDTYIWSSSTLYDESQKTERKKWFSDFKNKNHWNSKSALKFHKTAGENNDDFGVIMNRGFVKTTSITQVEKKDSKLTMCFESLQDQKSTKTLFETASLIND